MLDNAIKKDNNLQSADNDAHFKGFQVVRREFLSHAFEPAISFNEYKMYVNKACLKEFQGTEYVQVLINKKAQIMAILPCSERDRDSFKWCSNKNGVAIPKRISCKLFFAKLFDFMEWDIRYRYKLLGKVVSANDRNLIVFDLTATEVYKKIEVEGERPKKSRTPVFPIAWQDQFGLSYEEQKQSMQVDLYNGYMVYSIKDIVGNMAACAQ